MRSLGTRRVALITGAATVAVIALGACSAGQVAETANLETAISGVDAATANGSVLIRNLQVIYSGTKGYPAGSAAPLELSLYNQTTQPVTVLISSRPVQNPAPKEGVVSARQVGLVGGQPPSSSASAAPEPSGSRPPATPITDVSDQVTPPSTPSSSLPTPSAPASGAASAPDAQPARITLGPLQSASFLPGGAQSVQAIGLTDKLAPGMSLNLVFEFDNGSPALELPAPVAIPLSPASRAPGIPENKNVSER
jgi:hypothetical protein